MNRRKKMFLYCGAIGFVLAIGTMAWRSRRKEPQLQERAQRVVSIVGWNTVNCERLEPTYHLWLSETELLHFRNIDGELHGFRLTLDGSGQDAEIPDLRFPRNATAEAVSSDGRLLLWLKGGGDPRFAHPRISVLDGSSDHVRKNLHYVGSLLPSQHPHFRAIMIGPGNHYQIFSGDIVHGHPVALYHDAAPAQFILGDDSPSDAFDTIGVSGWFRMPQSVLETYETTNEFRVNYVLPSEDRPMVEHTIQIDKNKGIENVCPAPDRDRVFFEETSSKKDFMPEWIYRLFPAFRPHTQIQKRVLVVADTKTGKRKELATYEAPAPSGRYPDPFYIHDVQWAPDGKRLSFAFRQNLYTIPTQ